MDKIHKAVVFRHWTVTPARRGKHRMNTKYCLSCYLKVFSKLLLKVDGSRAHTEHITSLSGRGLA